MTILKDKPAILKNGGVLKEKERETAKIRLLAMTTTMMMTMAAR